MSTTNISALAFNGDQLETIVSFMRTGNDTVSKGLANIDEHMATTRRVPRIDVSNIIQEYNSDPRQAGVSQGTIDLDERLATKIKQMVYMELDPNTYDATIFETMQNHEALLNKGLPPTVEGAIINNVLDKYLERYDIQLWQSNTSTGSGDLEFFDGYLAKLTAGGAGTILVPSPVSLDASNIEEKMIAAFNLLPQPIKESANTKFAMSLTDYYFYIQAMQAKGFKNIDTTVNVAPPYLAKPVVGVAGLPAGKFVVGEMTNDQNSNFWIFNNFGVEGSSFEFDRLPRPSDKFYLKSVDRVDVQIAKPEEVVLYNA